MTEIFSDSLLKIKRELQEHSYPSIEGAVVLGSGLGSLADELTNKLTWNYADLPGFPRSTVPGHAGCLSIGRLGGKTVALFSGRFHVYEGYSTSIAAFPTIVAHELGAPTLVLTNAAGAVNSQWKPGDIMVFEDHIGFLCPNPLMGAPNFIDLTDVYNKELRKKALEVADKMGLDLKRGVYFFTTGPSYETPAEVRAAAILGADAVGMSTVPEAIMAARLGLKTVAFSCLTNMAAGITGQKLNHNEVTETANRQKNLFITFMKNFIEYI